MPTLNARKRISLQPPGRGQLQTVRPWPTTVAPTRNLPLPVMNAPWRDSDVRITAQRESVPWPNSRHVTLVGRNGYWRCRVPHATSGASCREAPWSWRVGGKA